jgi:hypothetical protein
MRVATKRAHYYKETALKPTVLAVQSEAEHKVIQVTSPKLLSGHVLCGWPTSRECMSELRSKLRIYRPIWPTIVITFGLTLTAAWIGLLGYGVFRLIELAI